MVAAFVVAAEAVKGGGVEIDTVAENFIAADAGGVFPAAGKRVGILAAGEVDAAEQPEAV